MEEQENVNQPRTYSYSTIIWGLSIAVVLLCGVIGILFGIMKQKESHDNKMNQVEKDMVDRIRCFGESNCIITVDPNIISSDSKKIVRYTMFVDCDEDPEKILQSCGINRSIGQPSISEE